ncbi:DddA-like double-stranded DNA deaminase toxin [Actinokineospora sp. NBRC 105648]|uniref:DddA-like double-stranded DNA deaminase toxin n=1 Tax=Actinokineospora sp. NBRC 105648 TaxID=3032206 RepID=UPI0024A15C59|nr:DddA-like double-stranded DNA deaminase toxin [Actinokineospora sp. NBRC 105648]GLZ41568.1 hypothetical protein Acsp05_51920 [Actinokineospora sp. NBRC 105648]
MANPHGDRYPPEAFPDADDLPPRVRRGRGNARLEAFIQIDGKPIGSITPARGDVWAQRAARRSFDLELWQADDVSNHVEMKAAVILVEGRGTHAQVILNHAPCGSEKYDPAGCDDYLPDFIPIGRSMTVLGTDARGNPFRRTYEGKAVR